MSARPAVEFKEVVKGFSGRTVLGGVSFAVGEGEALCIMGRSGIGKSVTLKLMIGLLKADSGQVCIGSEDIGRLAEGELSRLRRSIGFLFQNAALFDSFSVGDNLALPLRRFDTTKSPAEIDHTVNELLKSVGLEKDRAKMPVELSGGMRKRAGLARALVLSPKLLLVDEPSSGLDRITAGEIEDLLLRVKTERHTTLVIVTHDVSCVKRVADQVAVINEGNIASIGTLDELQSSENEVVRELTSESFK